MFESEPQKGVESFKTSKIRIGYYFNIFCILQFILLDTYIAENPDYKVCYNVEIFVDFPF